MRTPIAYNSRVPYLLYARLETIAGQGIRVTIEDSSGSQFGSAWSLKTLTSSATEAVFVANTWGDTAARMSSALLSTGWFERTGQSASFPCDEHNEVWKLSKFAIGTLLEEAKIARSCTVAA